MERKKNLNMNKQYIKPMLFIWCKSKLNIFKALKTNIRKLTSRNAEFKSNDFCSCLLAMILSKCGALLLKAIRMSACGFMRFLDFVLIDKRELNPDSHRYIVANGIRSPSAFSQSLGNIFIAEHQYSSKVLLWNCISRARFVRKSIRSSFRKQRCLFSVVNLNTVHIILLLLHSVI